MLLGQEARAALVRGIDTMTALLRPTLGPIPRTVAITRIVGGDVPEILDSAATIAKRTIQLPDPFEDMGGMLVRDLVERVFQQAGDGAATAAVLAQALVHEAMRYVAAGGSPQQLKRGAERGLAAAVAALRDQAQPIDGPEQITAVVAASLREPALAELLGEVVDAVGPEGAVIVEGGQGIATTHAYVQGLQWDSGYVSPHFLPDGQATAHVLDCRLFLTDRDIETAEQLLPVVEACLAAGERRLVVIAPAVRDPAVALLLVNRERQVLEQVLAIRAPAVGHQQTRILEDIAAATGGRCLLAESGEGFDTVSADHLGRARQVWAGRASFTVLGGQGNREHVRRRLAQARTELSATDDPYLIKRIRERIGRLSGAAVVIRVGGATDDAREERQARVDAALQSARLALRDGVVPGGGAALVACMPAVEALDLGGDERIGAAMLTRALAEPMRAIAANAGLEPSGLVYEARRRGPGWSYDVVRGEWVEARAGRLVDPLAVVQAGLETAVSGALMALTSEVLVRRLPPRRRR